MTIEALGLIKTDFPLVYPALRRYVIKLCNTCPDCAGTLKAEKCGVCGFRVQDEFERRSQCS